MRRPALHEILELISNAPESERQDLLAQQAPNVQLVMFLKHTFDPNIHFLLPSGPAPFKPQSGADLDSMFYSMWRQVYLFVKGGNDNLSDARRQMLYIQFLESLHPKDAELMNRMKDKLQPYPGIMYELVHRTFPGLLPDPSTVEYVNAYQEPVKVQKEAPTQAIFQIATAEDDFFPIAENNQFTVEEVDDKVLLDEQSKPKRTLVYKDDPKPCPFGCLGTDGSLRTFRPGPRMTHVMKIHSLTREQALEKLKA